LAPHQFFLGHTQTSKNHTRISFQLKELKKKFDKVCFAVFLLRNIGFFVVDPFRIRINNNIIGEAYLVGDRSTRRQQG
jgi:hypothetical protein